MKEQMPKEVPCEKGLNFEQIWRYTFQIPIFGGITQDLPLQSDKNLMAAIETGYLKFYDMHAESIQADLEIGE